MKKIILVIIAIILVLGCFLLIRETQKNTTVDLETGTLPDLKDGATPFTDEDLVMGKIQNKMTRSDVVRVLGEPDSQIDSLEEEDASDTFIYGRYITYNYGDDLSLTFYDFNGEMLLRKC